MLSTEPIFDDTDFLKLGEFSYRTFTFETVRKLHKAAQEAKTEFEWESGQAIISFKGLSIKDHLKITVEDENG